MKEWPDRPDPWRFIISKLGMHQQIWPKQKSFSNFSKSMATVRSNRTIVFFISFLIITAAPSPSQSLPFTSYFLYRDLFSRAHSLFTGVANLRASRGDITGAARARAVAEKLEGGIGFEFSRLLWSVGWDYAWRWRDFSLTELYGVVSDMNELLRGLTELTRLESAAERSAWVARNYQNVLTLSKSLSRKLLKAFGQLVCTTPFLLFVSLCNAIYFIG